MDIPGMAKNKIARGVAAGLIIGGTFTGGFFAHTTTTPKPALAQAVPILLVHGYSGGLGCAGFDVGNYWSGYTSFATANAVANPLITIGYYKCDTDDDVSVGAFTRQEDITGIAASLAWWIYNTYTVNSEPVLIVAHSMGGLITRAMIQHVAAADPAFPPSILVPQAVTVSSPFTGVSNAVENQLVCNGTIKQCVEFKTGSTWLAALDTNPDPQGTFGTDWSATGGGACDIVTVQSALALGGHTATWTTPCYSHTNILTDQSTAFDATATVNGVLGQGDQHSVAYAFNALTTNDQ